MYGEMQAIRRILLGITMVTSTNSKYCHHSSSNAAFEYFLQIYILVMVNDMCFWSLEHSGSALMFTEPFDYF